MSVILDKRGPEKVRREVEIDLHGYDPYDLGGGCPGDIDLTTIVRQAWEQGASQLRIVHGHARNRGISRGFVNTNTGYLGLCVRRDLRFRESLRQWIKYTTLDCSHNGSTIVGLKANPTPSRTGWGADVLPPPRRYEKERAS